MTHVTHKLRAAVAAAVTAAAAMPAAALELVMVHQPGCHYCEQWSAEIGPIYPKTVEGNYAPLRRARLGSNEMDGLSLVRRVNFTPTFVLVDDVGSELARLEGYAGEDFFWGLLERMLLEKTDYTPSGAPGG